MEIPSKTEWRQAWALSSRRKVPARVEDHQSSTTGDPQPPFNLQDDVFVDGCSSGKIETWLQSCGDEVMQRCHQTKDPLREETSFEDDLSLGAEATALYSAPDQSQISTAQQKLNLPLFNMGQSFASSAFSANTNRTVSSVSEVLQIRGEDAEDTLFQLGFGCEEPQVTSRIPIRFLSFPSQLRGINFRLFLESQLSRMRQEDPCLSLASRFRQVEALTAMANAFYSLYSHVSRTPLQKLRPPELSMTSPLSDRTMFRTRLRSEPRSPVERLKDTISKMCLFTGSHSSESLSPATSPRKTKHSVADVGQKDLGNDGNAFSDWDDGQEVDVLEWHVPSKRLGMDLEVHIPDNSQEIDNPHNRESKSDPDIKCEGRISVAAEPVSIISYDATHPKVRDYSNIAPYRCLKLNCAQVKDSEFANQEINKHTRPSEALSSTINASLLPTSISSVDDRAETFPDKLLHAHDALCQITVTGWEEDVSPDTQTCLTPVEPLNLTRFCQVPKQANSFELEEVHSAEEEEASSSEFCLAAMLSILTHHKSSPLRGDSFQSDSSGYAEDDVHPSPSTPEETHRVF